jgi:hypothetical protein
LKKWILWLLGSQRFRKLWTMKFTSLFKSSPETIAYIPVYLLLLSIQGKF